MPQPLRDAIEIHAGSHVLSERPKLAIYIALIAAEWTRIEVALGCILIALLKAETEVGVAMYMSLSGSSARLSALRAAAQLRLTEEEYTELDDLLTNIGKKAKQRNAIVHGCWGIKHKYPDALLLCDQVDEVKFFESLYNLDSSKDVVGPKWQIYVEQDFIDVFNRTREAATAVEKFWFKKLRDKQPSRFFEQGS